MERDYWELLAHAAELQQYEGYLDTQGIKQRQESEGRFATARNKFVYEVLKNGGDTAEISASVSADLDQIQAESDPSWHGSIALVRENLLTRIEKETRKPRWLRTAIRWTPIGLGVAAVVAYFGIRLFSAVDISQPIESRAGLEQRAAAIQKVIRYDDWMSTRTRRGGWLKGLLLWPIEPTEAEVRGASEFAALALDGHTALSSQGQICGVLSSGPQGNLSDQQVAFLGTVASHVRSEDVQWRDPPIMTVLDPIRQQFPCR